MVKVRSAFICKYDRPWPAQRLCTAVRAVYSLLIQTGVSTPLKRSPAALDPPV